MKNTILLLFVCIQCILLASCNNNTNRLPAIDLIPVKSGELMGYIDIKGNMVIAPQFKQAAVFSNGIALVQSAGKEPQWGYIDEKGNYVITPQYKYATSFSEGVAWVVKEHSAPALIDESGKVAFTLQQAEAVRRYYNGLAAFSIIDTNTNSDQWGFVDKQGNVVIRPQFSDVSSFSNKEYTLVQNNQKEWGMIDRQGKLVLNYQFDSVGFITANDVFAAHKPEVQWGVVDITGKYVVNPLYDAIFPDGEGFLVVLNGQRGWIDENGKIIISPQFVRVRPFVGNEMAPVKVGDKWGYIDKEGTVAINPQFDVALPFNNSVAVVLIDDKIGLIDQQGKYVVNPQYDGLSYDYDMLTLAPNWTIYNSISSDYFEDIKPGSVFIGYWEPPSAYFDTRVHSRLDIDTGSSAITNAGNVWVQLSAKQKRDTVYLFYTGVDVGTAYRLSWKMPEIGKCILKGYLDNRTLTLIFTDSFFYKHDFNYRLYSRYVDENDDVEIRSSPQQSNFGLSAQDPNDREERMKEIMKSREKRYSEGQATAERANAQELGPRYRSNNNQNSNNRESEPASQEEQIFRFVDEEASFPGGRDALQKYLAEHVVYPEAAKQAGTQGRVTYEFVINKDGSISNVTILKDIGNGCGQAIINAIKAMPKWTPAKNNDHPVKSYFTGNFRFSF